MEAAYRLVGYEAPGWTWSRRSTVKQTREEILVGLKACHDRHGYINAKLINAERGVPSVAYLKKTFGSLTDTYRLAGIPYSDAQTSATEGRLRYLAKKQAERL
jgi:hypothetical protein